MPRLIKALNALASHVFDEGTDYFAATNLEITTIDVGNTTENVIPESGSAKFNIRFNDKWSSESLTAKLHELLSPFGHYELDARCGAESFMTQPAEWSDIVKNAVKDITGNTAAFTTTGGTSDARFMAQYCPTVEFGGINETIHQINENAKVSDLEQLSKIYQRVLELYFA